ncbi:hypothetical protein CHS0354_037578 [Potamilus streckersoni]|uniref:C2H2-type domain-containing protein n=1 Tax=Potamilus streckersoni TaxID=2493646 RepID=A0AAE0SW56_9BIVA|nr:hypothetical protein CHS0354_037578 [Potamilus streckersoni]
METGDETQESRLSTILDFLITKAFHTDLGNNANNTRDRPECADAVLLESLTLLKDHPRNAAQFKIQSDSEGENKLKKGEIKLTFPKVSTDGANSALGMEDKRRSKFPGLSSLLKLHWDAQKDRVVKQMREESGRGKEIVDTPVIPFKIAKRQSSGVSKRTHSTMASNEAVDSEDGSSSLSHESDAASNMQESKFEENLHESSLSEDESNREFGSLVIDFENGGKSPDHSPMIKKLKVSHTPSQRENDGNNVYSDKDNVENSCNKTGNVKKSLRIATRKQKKNKDNVRNKDEVRKLEGSDKDIRSLIVPTGVIIPNKNLCWQPPLFIKEVTNVSCNAEKSGKSTVRLNPLQTENNFEAGTSQSDVTLSGIPATMMLNIDDNMRAAVLSGARSIVAKLQIIPGLSNQITPISMTVTSANTMVTPVAEKLVGSASLVTDEAAFAKATSKTPVTLASKPDAQAIVSQHFSRVLASVPVAFVNSQSLNSTNTVFSSHTPKTSISICQAIVSSAIPLTNNIVNADGDFPIATTSSPSIPVTSVPVSTTIPVPSMPWKHMVGCPMPAFPDLFTSKSEGLGSKELASPVLVFPAVTSIESKETVGRQEGTTTSPKPTTIDKGKCFLKSAMKVKDNCLPNAVASNKETLKIDSLKSFSVDTVGYKQLPSKKHKNRKELVNKEKDEEKPDLLTKKDVEPVMNDKKNKANSTILKALSRPLAQSIAEALSSPPLFSSIDLVPARETDVQEHESCPQFMEKINRDGKDLVAWKCSLCNKMFSRNYTYKRHLATHMGDRPYVCKTCGKGFTDKRYLYKHMRWHTGDKLLFCNVCQRPFSDESGLKKHSRLHSGENMCHCETCGKMFSDKSTLRRHLLNVHQGVKPFKCGLCDLSFVFRSHLEDHMRRHTGEKPYLCKFCSRGFAQIGTRNRHEKGHSGWGVERKYMCLLCQQIFPHPNTLKKHYNECHAMDQIKSKTEGAVAEKFEDEDFEEVDINDIAKELKDEIDTVAKTYLKDSSNTDSSVDEHGATTEEDDTDNSGSDDCSSDDMDESSDGDSSQPKEEYQKPVAFKQEPMDLE